MGSYDSESWKHSYYWLKERGICVKCGREYAVPGQIHCEDCREYFRLHSLKYINMPGKREEKIVRDKARYNRLKEAGICINCGKNKVYTYNGHTYTTCYECHIKHTNSSRKCKQKKNKHFDEQGLCVWCGGERKEGYKLCESCYEEIRRRGLKGAPLGAKAAKEKREKEGHPWLRYRERSVIAKERIS